MQAKKEELQRQGNQFDFKPKINSASKKLTPEEQVEERLAKA